MFLSNLATSLLGVVLLALMTAACGMQPAANDNGGGIVLDAEKRPFPTKEPEIFQCDITITANGTVRLIKLARNGPRRRIEFDAGTPDARIVLIADKAYSILPARRVYFEQDAAAGTFDQLQADLTRHLLSDTTAASYEMLSAEGDLDVYRSVNESKNTEIIVTVDRTLGIPVKQEFFSLAGERKAIYTVEVSNFSPSAGDDLFTLPSGLRKISAAEFSK